MLKQPGKSIEFACFGIYIWRDIWCGASVVIMF